MGMVELAKGRVDPATGQCHCLASLADDLETGELAWRQYYEMEAPEAAPLPMGYSEKLSKFERLLVLRCLRPDRVTLGITDFVVSVMGERYVQPPVLDYAAIWRQSSETTPIVFVLSPGADPAFDVFKLGEEMGFKPGEGCGLACL
jgi:dynein heavy chain